MLETVLNDMVQVRASDLFLKIGLPPAVRVDGQIRHAKREPLTEEEAQTVAGRLMNERIRERFEKDGEVDIAYHLPGTGRFRVNIHRERGQTSFVFRHVKEKIPTFQDLNLPAEPLERLAGKPRGLVLVTGIAGSGKSTTIASMLEHVNNNLTKHIITVEDPIEYLYTPKKCLITQREIGMDTRSFPAALKHAVRQSPNVILIGEMRDTETMEAALASAETGHLIFSTLHTVNATHTVERIINFFPPHQHSFIRLQLSMILEGVISLRLIRRMDGKGLVPAVEILLNTPTISELIAEGKTREIYKAMREDTYFGSQTFTQALKRLYQEEIISISEALGAVDNPEELKMELKGIQRGSRTDFEFNVGSR